MPKKNAFVFGPTTIRRMGRAYRYARQVVEQKTPEALEEPSANEVLANGIVEGAKQNKRLPRQLVRSIIDGVLMRRST